MDTVENILGPKPEQLQTVSDILGPRPDNKPMSGPLHDAFFSANNNPATHVLNAIHQGAASGWGATGELAHETQDELRKLGVYNDYTKGQGNTIKAFNEAWIRPTVNAAFGLAQPLAAGMGAVAGAIQGYAGELKREGLTGKLGFLSPLYGAAGEALGAIPEYVPELPMHVPEARSVGAIGESHETFVGTKEPTVSELQARSEATGSLPEPPPPTPTIHEIARQVAPETFYDYDILKQKHDLLTKAIREATAAREADPKVIAADEQIHTILSKVKGVEENLTKKQAERLADIRGGLEDYLSVDTPEMVRVKELHAKNYQEMMDLAPDVRAAYREAESHLNPQETGPRSALTLQDEHEQGVRAAETAALKGAAENTAAIKPSVIGLDASKKFQAAGRPKEESDAAGSLVQAHYESRASRFGGKLGTAEELYNKEHPDVEAGGVSSSGKELFQDQEKLENIIILEEVRARNEIKKSLEKGVQESIDGFEQPTLEGLKNRVTSNLAHQRELINKAADNGFTSIRDAWQRVYNFLLEHTLNTYIDEGLSHEYEKLVDKAKQASELVKKNLQEVGGNVTKLFQGKQGSLTINKDSKNTLRLFKSANASTVVHELGHQWLEELLQDAAHPEAPNDLLSDAKTVKDFLGVKDKVTRRQHEQFARGFERYLMEGIAPSKALANVFAKFKQWLTDIYKTVSNLRAPINNDIRKVFDRLLNEPDRTIIASEEAGIESTPTAISEQAKVEGPKLEGADQEGPKNTEYLQADGKFHLENIQSYSDLIAAVKQSAALNDFALKAKKGKISDDDRIKIAEDAGLSTSDINMDRLRAMSVEDDISLASRIYGLGQYFKQNAQVIKEILTAENPTNDDMIRFAEAVSQHQRAAETLLGIRAEWGRSGKALNQMLKDTGTEAELSSVLKNNIGLTYHQIFKAMKTGKQYTTTQQINKMANNLAKPSWGQNLYSYFINNLISGPITHATYAMGITGNIVRRAVFEGPTAATIGSLRQAFSKTAVERKTWGEVGDELHKVWFGSFDGFRALKAALKTGKQQGLQVEDLIQQKVFHEIDTKLIQPGSKDTRIQQLQDKVDDFHKRFNISDIAKDDIRDAKGLDRKIPPEFNEVFGLIAKSEPPQSFETGLKNRPQQPGVIGSIIRAPGERMVAPIHSINYTISLVSNLRKHVSRQARLEGEAGNWTDQQVAQRMAELQNDTPLNLIEQAKQESLEENLLNRSKNGSLLSNYKRLLGTDVNVPGLGPTPILGFAQPFVTIVTNSLKMAGKGIMMMNPVTAVMMKSVRNDLMGRNGVLARDLAVGKMVLGSTFFAAVWGMLEKGDMNGPASEKANERLIQEMSDGIPNGIRIGDMSFETERLGAIGLEMAVIADMHHFKDQAGVDGFDAATTTLMYSLGHHLSQTGPISGISDLFNAIDDSGRYGKHYWNGLLASVLTPYAIGLAQVAKVNDPYQRELNSGDNKGLFSHGEWNTLKKTFAQNIPFVREAVLYPKVDIFGQPMPSRQFWGVYAEKTSNDPVYKAFKDAGYFPAPIRKDINGYTLSEEQYFELTTKAGVLSKQLLDHTVATPGFNNLPPTVKHDMLELNIKTGRASATAELKIKYKDIPEMSVKMKKQLAEGLPTNE